MLGLIMSNAINTVKILVIVDGRELGVLSAASNPDESSLDPIGQNESVPCGI